jgi:predicted RNA-binding protein with TRAM domain
MAEIAYTPVPFNEGAPLDPALLMALQNNVKVAFTTSMDLSNSTGEKVYKIKSDAYKVKITGLGGNSDGRATVKVPGFTEEMIAVATVSSSTNLKEQITLEIKNVLEGSFDIVARSSLPARKEIWVNWHVSERQ